MRSSVQLVFTLFVSLVGANIVEEGGLEEEDNIRFAHWNPHWQCFESNPRCAANATAALTSLLSSGLDFANVIELESSKYTPPAGWAAIAAFDRCASWTSIQAHR